MARFPVVLIASIILNLFLAAALIAGFISLRAASPMINAGSLRIAGAELPVAERKPFRMALREARRAMRPTLMDARKAKMEAVTLLRAPTIDEVAVVAALDRARVADMAVRAAVERRAIAYAATLPLADRAKLAEAMQRRANKSRPATD